MRISTIIPAFNRAGLIGETLRSVLSQTRAPAEVIVVDDGSTDDTADAVAAFGKHVTLLRQPNGGAGSARNAGFARSTGEVVHFMDSDDLSSLNTYDVQARAIEQGADFVYGPWLKTRIEGRVLHPEPVVLQQAPVPARYRIEQATLLHRWATVFQPCLLRRNLIEAAGPYRTDLVRNEDTELLFRITCRKPRMTHTPETILLYRVHPVNQLTRQRPDRRALDHARLSAVLQAEAGAGGAMRWGDRWLMRSNLARAAAEVRPHAPDLADALESHIGRADRAMLPARLLADRTRRRLRAKLAGRAHASTYQAGPLTAGQRDQISQLHYTIADAAS